MTKVISPKPPIWISARIINWPKTFHLAKVSNTVRPVTHVALVAVKNASIKFVALPPFAAAGNVSRKLPKIITAAKLITVKRIGDKIVSFIFLIIFVLEQLLMLFNVF